MEYVVFSAIAAVIGLLTAAYFAWFILKQDPGSQQMQDISKAIQEGALAFLKREYKSVAYVLVIVAAAMAIWLRQPVTGIAYIVGAIFSGSAGFIGLTVATRANCRTTQAAKEKGLASALLIAFRGGGVMGMTVAGLGLLGVSLCFIVLYFALGLDKEGSSVNILGTIINSKNVFEDIIPGFGLGASTIALFARVGGGIFTKAADVGADLVGKVEAGIP
jgi:K(+)-stimulated pyrophosphate-energized sodium pump